MRADEEQKAGWMEAAQRSDRDACRNVSASADGLLKRMLRRRVR
jgi:hypothetical protein